MPCRKTLAFVLLCLFSMNSWCQNTTPPDEVTQQLSSLKRQLGQLQNVVKGLRTQLASEAAAREALQAKLNGLQATVGRTQADVRSLQANSILDLNGYLTLDNSSGYPTALFTGVNVQVVNGTGATQTANGLGNLVVGYNRPRRGVPVCSLGYYVSGAECLAKGGIWAQSHKSGSHNIVGGELNSYTGWGGLVVGLENVISAPYATVSAGFGNVAAGDLSSVSGGSLNTASAMYGSVGGGHSNIAGGPFSSVAGGSHRRALGSENWAAGALLQDR